MSTVLFKIKHLLILLLSWSSLSAVDYSGYGRLLERYAKESGVDYASWHKNKADLDALDTVVSGMAEVDVNQLTEAEKVAFYINLYNAAMLQVVFKNYPILSVTEIGEKPFDVFKDTFIRQGERMLSLDGIEKGILFEDHFDARIHFAVNCASESCPPLRAEPFTSERLEAQLEAQTRLFAESERAARVNQRNKTTAYSQLFNWYSKHFKVNSPAEYLNRYRSKALPLQYKTDWINYDWSLNAAD